MRLLVVDDQEAVCNIVAQIAAQGGWDCMYSTRSNEVLELVQKEKVDVLLMDYLMPGLDGLEAAQLLRDNKIDLPIVLFSGIAEEIDQAKAKSLGIMHILQKPLDIAELRRTLSAASAKMIKAKA